MDHSRPFGPTDSADAVHRGSVPRDLLPRESESLPLTSVAAAAEPGPRWFRFFEAFFQERNIQWILSVGMIILVGSSLMLVTTHWDTYTPLWKHLILLGYTAGLHAAGQVAFHSLGLRKTGTALMALTVLLIPLTFLAATWLRPVEAALATGAMRNLGTLAALGANTVFAWFAASRVFRHFLRRTQPTFLIAYLLLSMAGSVIPALPASLLPPATALLWGVFAVGAVKVNRHVFWLTEERRWPRIVGFFPILLLGGQFLALFAAALAPHLTLAWVGFGCALTALPVLMTADALARVFLEGHGRIARPLPWSVVLPTFVGISFTLAGVCLAGLRFPDAPLLVPTSAVAALAMGGVARRTGHRAFVWAMLAGILLAYQSSPVFFRELALSAIQSGADVLKERRLPVAFYGLTYLPLLLVASRLAAFGLRRGEPLFAPELRRFATALPLVLLMGALTHPKASWPVGLVLTALFTGQAALFKDRRLVLAAMAAWLVAALGFTPFMRGVLSVDPTTELPTLAWLIAGGALAFVGARGEPRTLVWLAPEDRAGAAPICRLGSLVVTLAAAVAWIAQAAGNPASAAPLAGALATAMLVMQARWWKRPGLADAALAFAVACPAMLVHAESGTATAALNVAAGLLAALWVAAPRWRRSRNGAGRVFAAAAERVASAGFFLATAAFLLPAWGGTLLLEAPFEAWLIASLATGWAFDAGRRFNEGWLTALGWFGLLATVGSAALAHFGMDHDMLPALWAVHALAVIPLVRGIESPQRGWTTALRRSLLVTLALIALASLAVFTTPLRIAGAVALVGLLVMSVLWRQSTTRVVALAIVNWQVVCGVVQLAAPGLHAWEDVTASRFAPAALPVAFVAALQSLLWQRTLWRRTDVHELIVVQTIALQAACGMSLIAAAALPRPVTAFETLLIVASFAALVADRVATALRLDSENRRSAASSSGPIARGDKVRVAEGHVWGAVALVGACVLHLALFNVIRFGNGASLFATLGAGVLAWVVSRAAARSPATTVLVNPLATTGLFLPAACAVLGVGRHLAVAEPQWKGMNSLALLLAAGFYFHLGLDGRRRGPLVASAAIVNIALALLWRELSWSDPQLFLVPLGASMLALIELLRDEIPPKALEPLRYAGALTILVSPTFHIVEGSWLHLLSLMVISVGVVLAAMGLRLRALMYAGTAFLVADVAAMVVRGSVDEPSLLWIAGILLGVLLVALAAYCERRREQMLQRLRMVAAELETWR